MSFVIRPILKFRRRPDLFTKSVEEKERESLKEDQESRLKNTMWAAAAATATMCDEWRKRACDQTEWIPPETCKSTMMRVGVIVRTPYWVVEDVVAAIQYVP